MSKLSCVVAAFPGSWNEATHSFCVDLIRVIPCSSSCWSKTKGDRQERDWTTLENDRRQMDSGQKRNSSGFDLNPASAIEGARIQRERITKQDSDEFGATVRCPGCNKRTQAHSDRCRVRIEECLRRTPQGAERLDRRREVNNEALAEEIQRGEQRKESRIRGTPAPKLASSTRHEMRENPTEPDRNPKQRLLMKSASSAASGSLQQRVERSATDAEPEAHIGVPMEVGTDESAVLLSALSANTRRIIAEKSTPVAIATQEGVDGYREKAMRVARVELVELGKIIDLSSTGHVLTWARQSNFSGELSLSKAHGWNLKNHRHLTVARHVREKTHPSMLVVTVREGEE